MRSTDFYLPLAGQPRISKRKSWRAPIVTEQGNPGIYVQIDEWLPLYKGNTYVVDEVTGRMYLSKGEHLMRIAETASHRPFQDHELSISRHVPEKECPDQEEQIPSGGQEPELGREREGTVDPLTPIAEIVGGIGRTPVPVTESTCQPGEKPFTPGEAFGGKSPDPGGIPPVCNQGEKGPNPGTQGTQEVGGPNWALA